MCNGSYFLFRHLSAVLATCHIKELYFGLSAQTRCNPVVSSLCVLHIVGGLTFHTACSISAQRPICILFYCAILFFKIFRLRSPDHELLRNNTRVRSFDSVGIRVKVKVYELIIA